jgi:hypothetical protein
MEKIENASTDATTTPTTEPTKFGSTIDSGNATANKLGRPVDPTSARQEKLRNASINPNSTGRQGRPVDPTSERQVKLLEEARSKGYESVAAYEAAKKDGTIKKGRQGRPVDPNSPRQIQLAEKLERQRLRDEAWAKINGSKTVTVDVTEETPVASKESVVEENETTDVGEVEIKAKVKGKK